MKALKRVTPCEQHHPVDYADEFADVRRQLRVIRLALGGGAVLDKLQGCDPSADCVEDTRAVGDLLEQIERRMDEFIEAREGCPVCSPPRAA